MRTIARRAALLVILLLLGFAGITAQADTTAPRAASPGATPAAVQREVINEGRPGSAPGQVLQLVRYTIPGNIALPAHTHPGMQVNVIVSGTLTYTVVEGSATVVRAGGMVETLTDGQTTDLLPGDRLTEPEGMVHFGENRGDEPIVILTASLFAADQPPSTIQDVPDATPIASPASWRQLMPS